MLEMPVKGPFYALGLRFSCTRCSACCRHEAGYVFLSQKDVSTLANELNIGYQDFIKEYCRWIPSVGSNLQLSLKEKSNFDCILWDKELGRDGGCLVYESRPLQCRAFPFWHSALSTKMSWKTISRSCPGMGKGELHSEESIKKWLALRKNEPIISKGAL